VILTPEYLSRYGSSLLVGLSATWIPVGSRFSSPVQTGTEAHPDSYKMGIGPFPGGKAVVLNTQPYVAPRLKKE